MRIMETPKQNHHQLLQKAYLEENNEPRKEL